LEVRGLGHVDPVTDGDDATGNEPE